MFLIVPYHVDVPMYCVPWMNWVLIGLTVLFFPLCITWDEGLSPLGEALILGGGSGGGYLGHVFVHLDIFHLLGNMIFLWVFGNAVCAKVGNLAYPFLYFGLGLISGLVAHLLDPRPAAGASGAINGIVGVFLVWYLLNEISCWYGYWVFGAGNAGLFGVSSYWIVLLWLVFDVWGLFWGRDNVGYVAHLAGLVAGVLTGVLLLVSRAVEMEEGERSLLQVFSGETETKPRRRKRRRRRTV
jgi:membrane associated rhomboid family serine protease